MCSPDRRLVIFIPEPFPEHVACMLGDRFEVRQGRAGHAYSEEALQSLLGDVDAVAINSRDPITARVIDSAPRLRVIAKAGSKPTSNVDLEAARRRGVRVIWTPGANAVSVAEMTIGLMLNMVRRIPDLISHLRDGGWRTYDLLGGELAERTLGVVGFGSIGRAVTHRFRTFGGKVLGYDPKVTRGVIDEAGAEPVNFGTLLARSDIISLHCEMNAETTGMIGRETLLRMKPQALLINTARGGLVDEAALLDALDSGRLAGAALDVFSHEPVSATHPLLNHPRVLATPHVAAFTHEASFRESSWALEDAARILQGMEPLHSGG